jgi:MraZ protein
MCNSLKVDQKGRLKIPVKFLSTFKGFSTEFYITSEKGDSVRIYPMEVWNKIEEQLEHRCLHNLNDQKLTARVKYFGQAVSIDKQNRVLIPIVLRNIARMKGAVDVLDYANYLEVWNHARLMNDLKSNSVTAHSETTLNELISSRRPPLAVEHKNKPGHIHGKARRFVVSSRLHGHSRRQLRQSLRASRTEPTARTRVA